jgi:hypothetical protein
MWLFPAGKAEVKNSCYIRVSPVSLYAFTAKTEKMPFKFLFNAAFSTLIDREIVVELRKKSSKGGRGGHDIFLLATFRHLFPEEANLHAVEWQDFYKKNLYKCR